MEKAALTKIEQRYKEICEELHELYNDPPFDDPSAEAQAELMRRAEESEDLEAEKRRMEGYLVAHYTRNPQDTPSNEHVKVLLA